MRPLLPLLVALAACGDPLESAWTGTCESSIGPLEILTAELSLAPPLADTTGEHDHYTASRAEITYPAGDVFTTTVSFAHCIDDNGCDTPSESFDLDNVLLAFEIAGEQPQVIATGILRGKKIEGSCETAFGTDTFFLERTRKGLE